MWKEGRPGCQLCGPRTPRQVPGPAGLAAFLGHSPVRVPISVVVAQQVILPHHLVSGNFQGLINRRQEIFTQTGDLAERKREAESQYPSWTSGARGNGSMLCVAGALLSSFLPRVSDTDGVSLCTETCSWPTAGCDLQHGCPSRDCAV